MKYLNNSNRIIAVAALVLLSTFPMTLQAGDWDRSASAEQREMEILTKELNQLKSEYNNLSSERQKLEQEKQRLNNEIQTERAKANQLKAENDALRDEIRKYESKLSH